MAAQKPTPENQVISGASPAEKPLLSREQISADSKLARYHLTILQALNDEEFKAMAVQNGMRMKESPLSQGLGNASIAANLIPVPIASQIAQLTLSVAQYAVNARNDRSNSQKAEKILAINPTHDQVEWKQFAEQLATKLTSENQSRIQSCKPSKQDGGLSSSIGAIFSFNKKVAENPEVVAVKAMAVGDCSHVIETILNKENLLEGKDGGIENDETRDALVTTLATSANTPSTSAKSAKASTLVSHDLSRS